MIAVDTLTRLARARYEDYGSRNDRLMKIALDSIEYVWWQVVAGYGLETLKTKVFDRCEGMYGDQAVQE